MSISACCFFALLCKCLLYGESLSYGKIFCHGLRFDFLLWKSVFNTFTSMPLTITWSIYCFCSNAYSVLLFLPVWLAFICSRACLISLSPWCKRARKFWFCSQRYILGIILNGCWLVPCGGQQRCCRRPKVHARSERPINRFAVLYPAYRSNCFQVQFVSSLRSPGSRCLFLSRSIYMKSIQYRVYLEDNIASDL